MYIHTNIRSFNADTYTPVQLYLQIRHHFRNCCLLESNDYHSRKDSRSFIGFSPLISISLTDKFLIQEPSGKREIPMDQHQLLSDQVQSILEEFQFEKEDYNGFFGRMSFEFSQADETHSQPDYAKMSIPLLHFFVFRFVLVIDHFTNEGFILENSLDGNFQNFGIEDILKLPAPSPLPFEIVGAENAQFTEKKFSTLVNRAIEHCKRGDVFQLVLSNAFRQTFLGDDFHVYRQLRRTNPSPYLFYFDFETYRLFGSSPEAQMVINKGKATIHPIAGTVPKTGNQTEDERQLAFLKTDEKENAEHTMLVDLARNDLSRNCAEVAIESYKEVQHFSHVIHLVSKVTGQLQTNKTFKTIAQSFPAGTLSGTPKPRALELIKMYESKPREFYGGAIGMLKPNGNANLAIVIRSVLSKENTLCYQAGAGIVIDSDPYRETKEVKHKLGAVRKAIEKADALQSETEISGKL